jgi:hypothetical protein
MAISKFFLKSKLEVSIQPVVSTSDLAKITKVLDIKPISLPSEIDGKPTSGQTEMKYQSLIVSAKKRSIHECKVKLIQSGAFSGTFLVWAKLGVKTKLDELSVGIMRDAIDFLPEEEIQLFVWRAYRGPEREPTLLMNTNPAFPITLGSDIEPLEFGIYFLSDEGPLHKDPYRFQLHVAS